MTTHKYIVEIDAKYWRVGVEMGDGKIVKCFSFIKHETKELALQAATQWRDRMLKKYNRMDRLAHKHSPNFVSAKRDTVIIGVSMTYNIQNGQYFFNWTARHQKNKVVVKKHFSINKYGDKTAFLFACEFRFTHSGKLKIVNKDMVPWKIPRKYL